MPKEKAAPQKVMDLKRQLQAADRELHRLHELQWVYSKRMLKFGMACWVLGLSMFLLAIIIMDAKALSTTYNVWIPLLVIALAVPMMITATMIRKFTIKIKYLERLRQGLITKYEGAILKRVEKMVTEG